MQINSAGDGQSGIDRKKRKSRFASHDESKNWILSVCGGFRNFPEQVERFSTAEATIFGRRSEEISSYVAMKQKSIEVQHGNVVVRIHPVEQKKNGRVYTNYFVSDYSTGRRKQWSFVKLEEARAKADEIARAITRGPECWEISLRLELRKAMEAIQPTGMSIFPAAQLFAQAVAMLGNPGDLLSACDHWKRTAAVDPSSPNPSTMPLRNFRQVGSG